MKVKTSITLSADVLRDVDHLAKTSSRSEVIEQALREFLAARARAVRDTRDRELYEKHFSEYAAFFDDVLTYSAPIDSLFESEDGDDA